MNGLNAAWKYVTFLETIKPCASSLMPRFLLEIWKSS